MRTTLDLDATVLAALKRRQKVEGKTLGRLVSELLTPVLAADASPSTVDFAWTTAPLRMLVNLEDKTALNAALDR